MAAENEETAQIVDLDVYRGSRRVYRCAYEIGGVPWAGFMAGGVHADGRVRPREIPGKGKGLIVTDGQFVSIRPRRPLLSTHKQPASMDG